MLKNKKNRFLTGFTLIELLIVIAIIGILAAIVFVNVGSARNKAKDAAIKGNLSNFTTSAEVFYDGQIPNTYVSVCTAGNSYLAYQEAIKEQKSGGTNDCDESATAWKVCVQLSNPTATWFCTDSTGVKKETTTTCVSDLTACP